MLIIRAQQLQLSLTYYLLCVCIVGAALLRILCLFCSRFGQVRLASLVGFMGRVRVEYRRPGRPPLMYRHRRLLVPTTTTTFIQSSNTLSILKNECLLRSKTA